MGAVGFPPNNAEFLREAWTWGFSSHLHQINACALSSQVQSGPVSPEVHYHAPEKGFSVIQPSSSAVSENRAPIAESPTEADGSGPSRVMKSASNATGKFAMQSRQNVSFTHADFHALHESQRGGVMYSNIISFYLGRQPMQPDRAI